MVRDSFTLTIFFAMNRTLRAFWRDSTPEQALAAPILIMRWIDAVQRRAHYLRRKFPSEDVEGRVMYALYKCAYSYRPDRGNFMTWLNIKIAGELCGLRRKQVREEIRGIHFERLAIDQKEMI
jgi:hypothetical protein